MRYASPLWLASFGVFFLLQATSPGRADGPSLSPVDSYRVLKADSLNQQLAVALKKGEQWPKEPVQIALRYLGPVDGNYLSVVQDNEAVENPHHSTVTLIAERLFDDSVGGIWIRLALVRDNTECWKVTEIDYAERCVRGDQKGMVSFHKEPCP